AAIDEINRTALDRADCLVALVPADHPSLGTPVEIERSVQAGKPTLVVSQPGPMAAVQMHRSAAQGAHVTDDLHEGLSWLVRALGAGHSRTGSQGQGKATEGPRTANEQGGWDAEPVLRFKLDQELSAADLLPNRQYPGDAGFDLYTSRETTIPGHTFIDVPCGCSVELPDGWWGLITGRSSTLRSRQLLVANGIIDQGYRGPLFVGVQNLTDRTVVVKAGERLGQLIPIPLFPGVAMRTEHLSESVRGHNGFGSSGQ